MNEKCSDEEMKIAENLRIELQERAGPLQRSNVQWFESDSRALSELAANTLGEANYQGIVEELKATVGATELISPHDEPLTRSIMKSLCEEIEGACRGLGVPLRSGVAYGSTASMETEAARYPVFFTEASIITFSLGFISFCSHASKLIAMSLPHRIVDKGVHVFFEVESVFEHINSNQDLKRQWTELIGAYAFGSGPIIVPSLPISGPPALTRIQLLAAMERFAIAHEYAHHVADHGKRDTASGEEDRRGKSEEYAADFFAVRICRHLEVTGAARNFHLLSGTGAVLLLKCLECVRRTRQILIEGDDGAISNQSHPETSARITALDSIDEFLSEPNYEMFKHARHSLSAVIDRLWSRLRPLYVHMHTAGLRPI